MTDMGAETMPKLDLTKVKIGDTVLARLTVAGIAADDGVVCGQPASVAGIGLAFFRVALADIIDHCPAPPPPLKAGERVNIGGSPGEIVAIYQDMAWVLLDHGSVGAPRTYPLSAMKRETK